MKVLIYVNKEKDPKHEWTDNLLKILEKKHLSYQLIDRCDFDKKTEGDVLFALGGDGTILDLTSFSNQNNIPIIGINAGKLGFLTEFERYETEKAVDLFINNELKTDKRAIISVEYNGKKYYALNDVVVQRMFSGERNMVISVNVSIDNTLADKIMGDGVIICTPTGSTAYSLSAGGAILAPGINAFSITPISAHSLSHRPIIYSADSECDLVFSYGDKAGLFIDGKLVSQISLNDKIKINKAENYNHFLRKAESNFFYRLTEKMKNKSGEKIDD